MDVLISPAQSALRSGPPPKEGQSGGVRHILLLDDDIGMQAVLMVLLEADFLVDTASTAAEGFHRLDASSPDLIILDVSLPDPSRAYFLQALQGRFPTCPVIVIAASEQPAALREMAGLRIGGFCRKPFHIDQLLRQIDTLVALRNKPLLFIPPFRRYTCRAIEYIHGTYARPLTVKAVAHGIGVTPNYLAYLFRIAIGMTVKQYLTRVRIEVTKRLLTNTDDTLDSIAERAGFCDASHISRVFRQHVGCWPGEYRRRPSRF